MNKNLVSIIVPIYNCEKYLKKCLNSLINQTYKNIEIILINDGSTDMSADICDEYSQKDKRIKVIHKKNEGVSIARNIGINQSNGKYLFFIDSDDWIDLNSIEELINNVSEENIVKMSHQLIKNDRVKSKILNTDKYYVNDFIEKIISGNVGGHSWGYLLHRNLLKDIYFDSNTSCMEDTLFIINYLMNVKEVKCIDTCFYYHVINESGITCSKDKILMNIHNYMYSLDKIEEVVYKENVNCDLKKNILIKRIYLIESEIAKIESKDELVKICDDIIITNILKKSINERIPFNYRIYIYCIINKRYNIILLYLKLRKLLKRIKNTI